MGKNHYEALGLAPGANGAEVRSAFDEMLAARRAKRQRTSELHAAIAVLGDPVLRAAYDASLMGRGAFAKAAGLSDEVATAVGDMKTRAGEVDYAALGGQVWQLTLRVVVLASDSTVAVASLTSRVSKRVGDVARSRITRDS